MNKNFIRFVCLSIMVLMLSCISAFAYQIDESTTLGATTSSSLAPAGVPDNTDAASATDGPVRLARFSCIQGNVSWRATETDSWSFASVNLPIRQGAEIWVTNGGRAEIQFDDGSLLRLGNGAVATLQTLYSDVDGEFTEIKMSEGLSTLILRHQKSIFQIDTPFAAIKSSGPSNIRVGVDNNVEVAVRSGKASISGGQGDASLIAGDYMNLEDSMSPYQIEPLPSPDTWDGWNDSRDRQLADQATQKHLPANIGLVAGDLSDYGVWRMDTQYGYVWCPRVAEADWRPYHHGNWVWVAPFGWTWVSDEPWGWAPYHYGTWVHEPWGWSWVPGPVNQYWCPAVVNFTEYNGSVGWVALAPGEVTYPTALFFIERNRGWSFFFSIGGAAVYYPQDSHYCHPRPWRNREVNHPTLINIGRSSDFNHNRLVNTHFVPRNSRFEGVSSIGISNFGGRASYRPEPRGSENMFAKGREIGAPDKGFHPYAGPVSVKPALISSTPSRSFFDRARPDNSVVKRPVYRAPLPSNVSKEAPVVNTTRWTPSESPKDRAHAARQSLGQTTYRPIDQQNNAQRQNTQRSTQQKIAAPNRDTFQNRQESPRIQDNGQQRIQQNPGNFQPRQDQPTRGYQNQNDANVQRQDAVRQQTPRQEYNAPTTQQNTETRQPDQNRANSAPNVQRNIQTQQKLDRTQQSQGWTFQPQQQQRVNTQPAQENGRGYQYRESSGLDTKPWTQRQETVRTEPQRAEAQRAEPAQKAERKSDNNSNNSKDESKNDNNGRHSRR